MKSRISREIDILISRMKQSESFKLETKRMNDLKKGKELDRIMEGLRHCKIWLQIINIIYRIGINLILNNYEILRMDLIR